MAICLYGLIATADVARLPALQGIAATPARAVSVRDMAALVSDLPRAPDRGRLDDVRAHEALLAQVAAAGITAVSSRFGQTFPSDEAVREAVTGMEAGGRIAALLREYRGCVEMRVLLPPALARALASPPSESAASSSPGRAYLERARETLRGPAISLAAMLPGLVRAERAEWLPEQRGAVVAHLVDRGDVDEHRRAVQSLEALRGARVVGPLPLYSFAGTADG